MSQVCTTNGSALGVRSRLPTYRLCITVLFLHGVMDDLLVPQGTSVGRTQAGRCWIVTPHIDIPVSYEEALDEKKQWDKKRSGE